MRLVAWNCNMALHRKAEALLSLRPDIAVISECAEPERLCRMGCSTRIQKEPVWIGRHATKGSAVFTNNAIWDKPGWRINHMTLVEILRRRGLVSAYHEIRREAHGQETVPTIYWRDRTCDGPTYHIDYVSLPSA